MGEILENTGKFWHWETAALGRTMLCRWKEASRLFSAMPAEGEKLIPSGGDTSTNSFPHLISNEGLVFLGDN